MTPWRVREMLNGTREEFDYVECGGCGCLQIAEIPADLGRFYPADYFSYRDWSGLARNRVRRWIDPKRVRRRFGGRSLVGALAEAVSRPLDYIDWVEDAGLGLDARILDVGCGSGKSLIAMALGGFTAPRGLDAFIAETIRYPLGVVVEKTGLEDFAAATSERFDLIMFHHALEHLPDPIAALSVARGLMSERGRIMIVVPVAGSHAWRTYREHWCNLDAPRHLHLLTGLAMAFLARRAGLKVVEQRSVGAHTQFVGSERYRRDIPANDPRRHSQLFSRRQLAQWRRHAHRLNRVGQGDQTLFYLKAAPPASGP